MVLHTSLEVHAVIMAPYLGEQLVGGLVGGLLAVTILIIFAIGLV